MTQCFKVLVTFKKRPYDQPIHFKVDGGRFDEDKTVKLNVNSKYAVEIVAKPPRKLEALSIQGGGLTPDLKESDHESAMFRTLWVSTDMVKTKKGSRDPLHIVMRWHEAGEMKLSLQSKLYSASEKEHSSWGSVLNHIELDCKVPENASFIDITKQTFR